MVSFGAVRQFHVQRAVQEYDQLGGDAFLEKYGFGRAVDYLLVQDGREYDSKAILGAALGYAVGEPATPGEFNGGRTGAARVLRDLGFDVVDQTARDSEDVDPAEARATWAEAARAALLETARHYQTVVSQKVLATAVQDRTGLTSAQPVHLWIGDVLLAVAEDNAARSEPSLPSLCVDERGRAGQRYTRVVKAMTGAVPEDADDHAAAERLRCHQHFGAVDLPSNGGRAAVTPQVARARAAAAPSPADRIPQLCPTCFVAVPASGICDACA
ncbi:hypothetical protein [Nocardioides sp. CFH 31398]|uniref:hypothetical protein n=1 Tax=Nocardioides sp. CFH 31398 TaxID=2919579 RepID=UPI001F0637AC|nr:hypothetical protein [Nocardioides sp. CFH 31398]MCH1867458.1 hypothetical protein [Nocardioides sp. CFH 31398]